MHALNDKELFKMLATMKWTKDFRLLFRIIKCDKIWVEECAIQA